MQVVIQKIPENLQEFETLAAKGRHPYPCGGRPMGMIMAGQVGGMSAQALRSFCHECTDPFDNRGQKGEER